MAKPTLEIVRQADGRDLLLYDHEVVGIITVERDEPMDNGGRRVALTAQAVQFGDFEERVQRNRYNDVTIGGRSSRRFKTEGDYDAWINGDHPEDA